MAIYLRELIDVALRELRIHQPDPDAPQLSSVYVHEKNCGRISTPERTLLNFSSESGENGTSIILSGRKSREHRHTNFRLVAKDEKQLITAIISLQSHLYWWQNRLTVYSLKENVYYEVRESFEDYDGVSYTTGSKFKYLKRHYSPYDDGHTLYTSIGNIRLQGSLQKELLDNLDKHLAECGER